MGSLLTFKILGGGRGELFPSSYQPFYLLPCHVRNVFSPRGLDFVAEGSSLPLSRCNFMIMLSSNSWKEKNIVSDRVFSSLRQESVGCYPYLFVSLMAQVFICICYLYFHNAVTVCVVHSQRSRLLLASRAWFLEVLVLRESWTPC